MIYARQPDGFSRSAGLGWQTRVVRLLAAATVFVLVGCDETSSRRGGMRGLQAPADDSPPDSPQLIVSKSAFAQAFLLVDDGRVRWRFDGDRFVVESWREPLPGSLRDQLLQDPSLAVYRIAGRWDLSPDGRRMMLTDLSSDHVETVESAKLKLDEADERLKLDAIEYELANHPGTPEFHPDEVHRGRCERVLRGDLLEVRFKGGQTETLQLAGILCPSADTEEGQAAIAELHDVIQNERLLIRIFNRFGDSPRSAQIITNDLIWLNFEMVRRGFAWHDKTTDREWQFALREDHARQQKLGLWATNTLPPPWLKAEKETH